MKLFTFLAACSVVPVAVCAQTGPEIIAQTVAGHILPRFEALEQSAAELALAAQQDCTASSEPLRAAYGQAFDAWIAASHLRFGPTEVDDRAFALAFWPDSRGVTPRSLAGLIADQDDVVASAESYAQVSIAARGFYALEFLLFDAALMTQGDTTYHCTLVQTVTADIAATSTAISQDWQVSYAPQLLDFAAYDTYRSEEEVLQELFKALNTGLEFTAETRLGRPLGTYDRPRPKRAENWRSGRSSHNIALSLEALGDLAAQLAVNDPDLAARLAKAVAKAQSQLADFADPAFASITDPQRRFKLEVIQQSVTAIRDLTRAELGPTLGVAAGFNALDGD
ncbi:MAG: imelysin family protein [Sulfitobacter sp.]